MQVKQISNLFKLMELFAREQKPLSVKEIVSAIGWPRSSVFNLVATLVNEGYLYQPVPRGGYCPSTRWMELANSLVNAQPLPAIIHQRLVEAMEQTGETLFLATSEGSFVVFLDVVEPSAEIRFTANIGHRLPIHVTAAGRAILSLHTAAERKAILQRIEYSAHEDNPFLNPEAVEKDIEEHTGGDCYMNMGLYRPGVAGIAVPFMYRNRRMAIALGGPVSRVEEHAAHYEKLLREAVSNLLNELES